ncbi:MAG: GDSL-type esterase/lipase family protein [Isosphaeraceae bacterium]
MDGLEDRRLLTGGASAAVGVLSPSDEYLRMRLTRDLQRAKSGIDDVVFLGDSITDAWGDTDRDKGPQTSLLWNQQIAPLKATNFGLSGDTVGGVTYQVRNGELVGKPKVVVLLIGTNDLIQHDKISKTPEEVAAGIATLIQEIQTQSPQTKILLMGIFPRGQSPDNIARAQVRKTNALIAPLADGNRVRFLDIGASFLQADGSLSSQMFFDFVHPTYQGYKIWCDALQVPLRQMLDYPQRYFDNISQMSADYDGDGKTDPAVFDPKTAQWSILQSTDGPRTIQFGAANSDIPVPGDYDGDGKTDLAIYRPSTGQCFILQSTDGPRVVSFGAPVLDVPLQGDFDGDGKADLAVYRPTTSQWLIAFSGGGARVVSFGAPGADTPVPADYDGDGKTDLAVYRTQTSQWFILQSTEGARVEVLGIPGLDKPIPTDFDGDGKADLAVYRPSLAQWLIHQSTDGPRVESFGAYIIDVPLRGDFDGDGKADLAVYRPTTGQWLILRSSAGALVASSALATTRRFG